MAQVPTLMNEKIAEYASKLFSAEDDFLKELLQEAQKAGIPPISIGGQQAAFLQTFLRAMQARSILEIGSLAGYSAIVMARVLPPDGHIYCLEINAEYAEFIRKQAQKASLQDKITVLQGPATQTLQALTLPNPLDFVFIDADKPSYKEYLELITPMLRPGGVIAGDNALAWGWVADQNPDFEPENVKGIQEFNAALAGHPAYMPACLVPIGDGMAMAVRR
jgi:predicted O-methyltransferase YrrM